MVSAESIKQSYYLIIEFAFHSSNSKNEICKSIYDRLNFLDVLMILMEDRKGVDKKNHLKRKPNVYFEEDCSTHISIILEIVFTRAKIGEDLLYMLTVLYFKLQDGRS